MSDPSQAISRRNILVAACVTALAFPFAAVGADLEGEYPSDPETALKRLLAGNARFVKDEPRMQHVGRQWLARLTKQQHPYDVTAA